MNLILQSFIFAISLHISLRTFSSKKDKMVIHIVRHKGTFPCQQGTIKGTSFVPLVCLFISESACGVL